MLTDLLADGPVVLIFFRFADCPACNAALGAYQATLAPALGELGAHLVAISPQVPERLVAIKRRHEFDFLVASDTDATLLHTFGIAFAPDLNRGFTSNGGDSTVTVFDLKTLKTLGKVKANGRPDIITYEPVTRRILSFNHGTNDITAIDPAEMKVVGTLAAGGVPELAVSDEKGHVFCNLEDTSEIIEFDAKTMTMIKKFSLAPGETPTGLAFDPKQRKLFSTCGKIFFEV